MPTVNDLRQEALDWGDAIEELDGVIEGKELEWLERLDGNIEAKAMKLFFVRQRAKARQAEAKELVEIGKTQIDRWRNAEDRILWLLKNLLESKELLGSEGKITGAWGTASLTRRKSLEVGDPDAVPPEWHREKTTRSIDKAAITKALRAGDEVPGCRLVEVVGTMIRSK